MTQSGVRRQGRDPSKLFWANFWLTLKTELLPHGFTQMLESIGWWPVFRRRRSQSGHPLEGGAVGTFVQRQNNLCQTKVSSKELRGVLPLPPAPRLRHSFSVSLFTSFSISFSILFFSLFPSFCYSLSASIFTFFLLLGAFSLKTSLLPFSSPLWCFSYIFTLPGPPLSSKKWEKASLESLCFLHCF